LIYPQGKQENRYGEEKMNASHSSAAGSRVLPLQTDLVVSFVREAVDTRTANGRPWKKGAARRESEWRFKLTFRMISIICDDATNAGSTGILQALSLAGSCFSTAAASSPSF
jgi:hypothetical protein